MKWILAIPFIIIGFILAYTGMAIIYVGEWITDPS